jgi:hypothetical protein
MVTSNLEDTSKINMQSVNMQEKKVQFEHNHYENKFQFNTKDHKHNKNSAVLLTYTWLNAI